jgi:nucleotide sugar dehydrogenase
MFSIIGLGMVGGAIAKSFQKKNIIFYKYDKYKKIGNIENCLKSQFIFLCLPTPYSEEINEYDKTEIYNIIEYFSKNNYRGLLILKSTVEPFTTSNIVKKYKNINLIHNPEFLTARTAFEDFQNQNHIVIGRTKNCDENLLEKIVNFFKINYTNNISLVYSDESELMKLTANSFYACKIQFFNEIFDLCKNTNISYENIKQLILKNNWINPMHTDVPGPDGKLSYGGACLPKDSNSLLSFMKKTNTYHNVLNSVVEEKNIMRK